MIFEKDFFRFVGLCFELTRPLDVEYGIDLHYDALRIK